MPMPLSYAAVSTSQILKKSVQTPSQTRPNSQARWPHLPARTPTPVPLSVPITPACPLSSARVAVKPREPPAPRPSGRASPQALLPEGTEPQIRRKPSTRLPSKHFEILILFKHMLIGSVIQMHLLPRRSRVQVSPYTSTPESGARLNAWWSNYGLRCYSCTSTFSSASNKVSRHLLDRPVSFSMTFTGP